MNMQQFMTMQIKTVGSHSVQINSKLSICHIRL